MCRRRRRCRGSGAKFGVAFNGYISTDDGGAAVSIITPRESQRMREIRREDEGPDNGSAGGSAARSATGSATGSDTGSHAATGSEVVDGAGGGGVDGGDSNGVGQRQS